MRFLCAKIQHKCIQYGSSLVKITCNISRKKAFLVNLVVRNNRISLFGDYAKRFAVSELEIKTNVSLKNTHTPFLRHLILIRVIWQMDSQINFFNVYVCMAKYCNLNRNCDTRRLNATLDRTQMSTLCQPLVSKSCKVYCWQQQTFKKWVITTCLFFEFDRPPDPQFCKTGIWEKL